jgi:hypothetical protein
VRPSLIAAAIPVEISGMKTVIGVGVHQAVDLDHYYQNNTILEPNLGLYRPAPLPVVTGQDSMLVKWYAYERERIGAINGFTASASLSPIEDFSIGISATYYHGTSDDREISTTRGNMTFFYDSFRLDQSGDVRTVNGTSTWSGFSGGVGMHYRDRYFSVGGTVRLPFTIKREWERMVAVSWSTPPADAPRSGPESGKDEITYPMSLTVGLALMPSEVLTVAGEISIRQTKDVAYAMGTAAAVSPWLESNLVHLGVEYRLWSGSFGGEDIGRQCRCFAWPGRAPR